LWPTLLVPCSPTAEPHNESTSTQSLRAAPFPGAARSYRGARDGATGSSPRLRLPCGPLGRRGRQGCGRAVRAHRFHPRLARRYAPLLTPQPCRVNFTNDAMPSMADCDAIHGRALRWWRLSGCRRAPGFFCWCETGPRTPLFHAPLNGVRRSSSV